MQVKAIEPSRQHINNVIDIMILLIDWLVA